MARAGDANAMRRQSECRVRRAARTFVGFGPGMSLEDFELAAFEGERILRATQTQLCEVDDALDPGGSLRAVLRMGAIELTSIAFTRADAGAADVVARRVPDARAMPAHDSLPESWSLQLLRTQDSWRVVRADPAEGGVPTDAMHDP